MDKLTISLRHTKWQPASRRDHIRKHSDEHTRSDPIRITDREGTHEDITHETEREKGVIARNLKGPAQQHNADSKTTKLSETASANTAHSHSSGRMQGIVSGRGHCPVHGLWGEIIWRITNIFMYN